MNKFYLKTGECSAAATLERKYKYSDFYFYQFWIMR